MDVNQLKDSLSQNCFTTNYSATTFSDFYESRKNKWVGQTEAPKLGEIVICFKYGNLEFYKKLGDNEPKDLGKELTIEFSQAPDYLLDGQMYDVLNPPQNKRTITISTPPQLRVVAVVDDRDSSFASLPPTYLDYSYLENSIVQADPEVDLNTIKYYSGQIFIDNYNNLDSTIKSLQDKKYLASSLAQIPIQSVKAVFQVLTFVLVGFGLIVLIASVFGIINVMTISVLERQKEIGILKSLGPVIGIFLLYSFWKALYSVRLAGF